MSNTPRTDAEEREQIGPSVPTWLARQLERELNAANAELAALRPQLSSALVCVKCGQRIPHSDYHYSVVDTTDGSIHQPYCAPCIRAVDHLLTKDHKIVQHP